MALVIISVLPILIIAAYFQTKFMTGASTQVCHGEDIVRIKFVIVRVSAVIVRVRIVIVRSRSRLRITHVGRRRI